MSPFDPATGILGTQCITDLITGIPLRLTKITPPDFSGVKEKLRVAALNWHLKG
jgi:hypothetical protein